MDEFRVVVVWLRCLTHIIVGQPGFP